MLMLPTAVLCLMLATTAGAKEGVYLGLGLGGGLVSGEDSIELKPKTGIVVGAGCTSNPECISTNFAEGFGGIIRLGYNILGMVAVEAAIASHASDIGDKESSWMAHAHGNLVIHPIGIYEFSEGTRELELWDPYLFIGGGYTGGGYYALGDDKGWQGPSLQTGGGINFHLVWPISIGLDFRVIVPYFETWVWNRSKDQVLSPEKTASPIIFLPTATFTAHFG